MKKEELPIRVLYNQTNELIEGLAKEIRYGASIRGSRPFIDGRIKVIQEMLVAIEKLENS